MSSPRSNPTATAVEPWNVTISPKTIRQVSVVCFIAWVASVYDFTLFGTLLPVIAEEFGWSVAESAAINTYATIGVFIVALTVGTIIDRMGRKRALIVLMLGGGGGGFLGGDQRTGRGGGARRIGRRAERGSIGNGGRWRNRVLRRVRR